MTEGGTSAVSNEAFSRASGDADEIFCDPCLHGGKSVAVDGYCQICEEYMCSSCIEFHRNQKLSRGHAILNKSQMPTRLVSSVSSDLCTVICRFHHPEIIRFYCKTHDETGCVDCMTLDHTACTKERIQDIADGFQKTKEFKLLHQNLDSFHSNLEDMTDILSKRISHIGAPFETIEQKIESFYEKVDAYVDVIQKKIAGEVEALRIEEETPLKQLVAENETLKSEVKSISQNLQKDNNVNSSFVLVKQTRKRMVTMLKQFDDIKQKQHQPKEVVFNPSPEITKLLSSKAQLGTITRMPDISGITASYCRSINIKASKDDECWVFGSVLLGLNRMVVTDRDNNKIKLIDIVHNRIIFSYKTSTPPVGLTTVSTDKVAVALRDESTLLVLKVAGNQLTKQCEIKLKCSDKDWLAIAYKDGLFAVSFLNPGRVGILDAFGTVLHTIQPKLGNVNYLVDVRAIKFGQDNGTLIVSDCETDKVSVVSFDGEILQTYSHDTLKSPDDLCVTSGGILFVSCYGNRSIHAVNPDFKSSKVIIRNDERLPRPYSTCYCEKNCKLYINNWADKEDEKNNLIHVFELSNI